MAAVWPEGQKGSFDTRLKNRRTGKNCVSTIQG